MPRYLSTSPFETVVFGLSVDVDGTTVHPADSNPAPAPGSTVVLNHGDELDVADPIHFPGCCELDADGNPIPPAIAPAEEPTP